MSTLKRYNGTSWETIGGNITGDTLPIGSEIDYTGSSVPAGWEEVADYSTNEVNTGMKWIDGRDIYRKVYHNDSYSQSASRTEDITFSLPDLDIVVNVYGSSKVNSVVSPMPSALWANAVGTQYSFAIGGFTSTGFKVTTGSDNPLNSAQLNIVFEYVKTTD